MDATQTIGTRKAHHVFGTLGAATTALVAHDLLADLVLHDETRSAERDSGESAGKSDGNPERPTSRFAPRYRSFRVTGRKMRVSGPFFCCCWLRRPPPNTTPVSRFQQCLPYSRKYCQSQNPRPGPACRAHPCHIGRIFFACLHRTVLRTL